MSVFQSGLLMISIVLWQKVYRPYYETFCFKLILTSSHEFFYAYYILLFVRSLLFVAGSLVDKDILQEC